MIAAHIRAPRTFTKNGHDEKRDGEPSGMRPAADDGMDHEPEFTDEWSLLRLSTSALSTTPPSCT